MSAEVRDLLAAAANTVEGVRVSPYIRQSTRPGDGSVRLDRVTYPDKFGGLASWQVVVCLPQDTASAEKYLDQRLDELVTALSDELIIQSAQPIQLTLDSGTVPALIITGIREKD